MNSEKIVLNAMRGLGRSDALSLRQRANDMTGTEVIAEEEKIPTWVSDKDYTEWVVGAPVQYNGQVYKLLQPHNAAHYTNSTPETERALWGLCHTTDPTKAKPYIAPLGISGMYLKGECCTDPKYENPTTVFRLIIDSTSYRPSDWPQAWEVV